VTKFSKLKKKMDLHLDTQHSLNTREEFSTLLFP